MAEKRAGPTAEWPTACFTSPDHPITRLLSFHDDLSGHIVVSCAANNAALHPELTLFRGIESDCHGST
jgi:hypothetical protein